MIIGFATSSLAFAQTAPDDPTGINVDSTTHNSVTVSWTAIADWGDDGSTPYDANSPGSEYEVCATPASGPSICDRTAGTNITLTVGGLDANTAYNLTVQAINASVASTQAAGPGFTTLAAPLAAGNVNDVPTMSEWALIVMALLIAASAVMFGRRRQQ